MRLKSNLACVIIAYLFGLYAVQRYVSDMLLFDTVPGGRVRSLLVLRIRLCFLIRAWAMYERQKYDPYPAELAELWHLTAVFSTDKRPDFQSKTAEKWTLKRHFGSHLDFRV